MPIYTIPRTGARPLQFEGDIIAQSHGRQSHNAEHNRWHDITIYRTAHESYIVHLHYDTTWRGETGHDEYHIVATLEEVAFELENYDPTLHVEGFKRFGDKEPYIQRQAVLLDDIKRRYLAQVSELCNQLGIVDTL